MESRKGDTMKTIAVISQKGGSGKTTLAINLAGAAEAEGLSVVIIDTDQQASAKAWHKHRLKQRPDNADAPVVITHGHKFLEEPIETARKNGVDLCIIDTAPHSSEGALEAAKLADLVLIPLRTSYLDLDAVKSSVNIVQLAKAPAMFILSCVRPGDKTMPDEAEAWLIKHTKDNPIPVCPVRITLRSDCVHALTAGQTIAEFAPAGAAAQEIHQLLKLSFHQDGKMKVHQANRETVTA